MRRVFVVEDEAVVAMELQDHLRALGYEVCGHAARGEAALRQIPEARPDLVLMDINLGPGITGLDVAERLRDVTDVPVLFLTAYSDAEVTERAVRSGAFAYVVKPFEPRALGATIELALLRRDSTAALRASEERHRCLFNDAIEGIFRTDLGGVVLDVNPAFARLLGHGSPGDLAGASLYSFCADPEGRRGIEELYAGRDAPGGAPVRWRKKDGEHVLVELHGRLLRDARGEAAHYQGFARDVTARERMEEERARLEVQLRQAQKMEALGTLAGGIAHDFNNLLAAIVGNVELARAEVVAGGPVSDCLDEIGAASSRAVDLVKQILAFSRKQPASRAVTPIRPVVDEVWKLLRATIPAGIEITAEVSGAVPSVLVDPTRIHQVLMNLGTNAWHAIERGTGKIGLRVDAVSVAPGASPAPRVRPGRWVRIQVRDDGKGMDEATLERIFDPFFTTKEVGRGTGLGLAVAHGIVADHGGAITVESAPGRGATFTVYLPEAAGEPGSAEPSGQPVRHGAGRVLFIDDEEPLVRVAKRLMSQLGYQVTGFVRASEALEAIRADPRGYDVVVTDQNMPELSGLEVARKIAGLREDLPVVLVSGHRGHSDGELAAANVQSFLDKPYTQASLSQALDRALGRA